MQLHFITFRILIRYLLVNCPLHGEFILRTAQLASSPYATLRICSCKS